MSNRINLKFKISERFFQGLSVTVYVEKKLEKMALGKNCLSMNDYRSKFFGLSDEMYVVTLVENIAMDREFIRM